MADRHVAIIGAGTMGADVAAIFIRGGWRVQLVEPERRRWPDAEARVRHAVGQLGGDAGGDALAWRDALEEVDWLGVTLAIECAPERLPLKQSIFAALDRLAPAGTILASNSSSFPITDIAGTLATRARMINLHFFMPAHLVPAVEVVRGAATDDAAWTRAAAIMRELGKVPVMVRRDVPGFLANRLQHAMMREAFALIDAGLAAPEDIDAAVRYGFGLRYLAAGPVLQKDIAGLDIHHAASATMYPHLASNTTPSPTLAALVADGRLGMKTGEGFYRWSPEAGQAERARYERALLAALAVLDAERDGDA